MIFCSIYRLSASKPVPGEIVDKVEERPTDIENAKSIDDPCLGIRRAYLKYLYHDEVPIYLFIHLWKKLV